MTAKRKILQNNERKDNDHLKYRGIKQNSYILNSAVFFLVRKFYGWFYKLALLDFELIFEVKMQESEGV